MAKGKNQKIKLLKILEILRNESSPEKPMSTPILIEKLQSEGIDVERKALYDDIRLLNESGYEIFCERAIANQYYVDDMPLSVAEVRILLDAVQSAKFITEKKTEELCKKLSFFAGKKKGEEINSNLLYLDRNKNTNERIFYSVDSLNQAIEGKRKVSFKYFDFNIDGERVFRKRGAKYYVNPINLICTSDNYYLTSYSDKYKNLVNYRVDRMSEVTVLEEGISSLPDLNSIEMSKYLKRVFSMYGGKHQYVEMVVDKSLLDVIFDKFGKDAQLSDLQDGNIFVRTSVELSPTFFGWVASFGKKMKITAPLTTKKLMIEHLKDAINQYELD